MLLGKVDVHDGDKEWHFFLLFVFSQTKKGYAKVVLGLLQADKKHFSALQTGQLINLHAAYNHSHLK